MASKLYRSRTDRMIGGVCGGLGEYLGIDSTIVRLVLVLLTLAAGAGVLAYIIGLLVIPLKPAVTPTPAMIEGNPEESAAAAETINVNDSGGETPADGQAPRGHQARVVMGVILLTVGCLSLLNSMDIPWLRFDRLWPMLLIVFGVLLIYRRPRGE